jgi:hypothetical protein
MEVLTDGDGGFGNEEPVPAAQRARITLRAVDFTDQGGGKAIKDDTRGDAPIIWLWNDAGHWLEWGIQDGEPGKYEVLLRYAADAPAPRKVTVNDKIAKAIEMPATGGWNRWTESKMPEPISLRRGRNTLRMESLGGTGLNLERITLVPVD